MDPVRYLTVVIPTYNRADSLRCTLQALGRQTLAREMFEVIVIDDGSTDGTAKVLQEIFDSNIVNLRFKLQKNAGPGEARNHGAREAVGEIILYIDDDIEPDDKLLETHATYHQKNDNLVVIGPMSPDPALEKVEPMWIAWEHAMLQKTYGNLISGVWPVVGPNLFYSGNASLRRTQLLAIGGFDTSFKRQEDVEMAARLFKTFNVDFVFDPLANGLHRPKRTFESWYAVPYSYGQYDVIRYKRGEMTSRDFTNGFDRHAGTLLLANLVMTLPTLSGFVRSIVRSMAQTLWVLGNRKLALRALSALYNARYMEGAAKEMGTRSEVRRIMLDRRAESRL